MLEATFLYKSNVNICCGPLPSNARICLDSSLLTPLECPECPECEGISYGYLDVEIVDQCGYSPGYGCVDPIYNYTLKYDASLLSSYNAETEEYTALTSEDVTGIFCLSCFTDWVTEKIGNEPYFTVADGVVTFVSPHGCEYSFTPEFLLTVADTDTVDISFDGLGSELSADVIVDPDATNTLQATSDGLFVPAITVSDSATIDLTLTGTPGSTPQNVAGAVKISADADNIITAVADGIYAPEPPVNYLLGPSWGRIAGIVLNQTNQELYLENQLTFTGADWVAPLDGEIIGISRSQSSAISAGTLTVKMYVNALTNQSLAYTSGSESYTDFAAPLAFSAGDKISAQYSTTLTYNGDDILTIRPLMRFT